MATIDSTSLRATDCSPFIHKAAFWIKLKRGFFMSVNVYRRLLVDTVEL
ncbi:MULTISPECIES: hypothetical protein [Alteromonas]|nr:MULTISPECIES: hypothetical protein [Alteromonas]MCH2256532.1 hypothetical protein [Alteromonas sp.]